MCVPKTAPRRRCPHALPLAPLDVTTKDCLSESRAEVFRNLPCHPGGSRSPARLLLAYRWGPRGGGGTGCGVSHWIAARNG